MDYFLSDKDFLGTPFSLFMISSYPSHPITQGASWLFSLLLVLYLLFHPRNILGEGNGTPLQYSCLENPMDGGAWWAAVHGVARNQTRLSDFTFTFHFHALEKEMATHSSVLAWRIPGMGEAGGLAFLGLHRVGHDWSNLAAAVAAKALICIIHRILLPRLNSDVII